MASELRFPAGSTIYLLKSVIRMMIPDGQNALNEKWIVNRFISRPYQGCPVSQITKLTEIDIGDMLTSIAMCKEIVDLDAFWVYEDINVTMTLTINNNEGRLHLTNPELQEYVGQMLRRISEQPDQFP